jgi:hypothetical protein
MSNPEPPAPAEENEDVCSTLIILLLCQVFSNYLQDELARALAMSMGNPEGEDKGKGKEKEEEQQPVEEKGIKHEIFCRGTLLFI